MLFGLLSELTCFRRLTRIIWILKFYRKCGAIIQGMCCLIWRIRIRCRSRYNAWNNDEMDVGRFGIGNGFLSICSARVNFPHENPFVSSLLIRRYLYDLWSFLNVVSLQHLAYESRIASEISPFCILLSQI